LFQILELHNYQNIKDIVLDKIVPNSMTVGLPADAKQGDGVAYCFKNIGSKTITSITISFDTSNMVYSGTNLMMYVNIGVGSRTNGVDPMVVSPEFGNSTSYYSSSSAATSLYTYTADQVLPGEAFVINLEQPLMFAGISATIQGVTFA